MTRLIPGPRRCNGSESSEAVRTNSAQEGTQCRHDEHCWNCNGPRTLQHRRSTARITMLRKFTNGGTAKVACHDLQQAAHKKITKRAGNNTTQEIFSARRTTVTTAPPPPPPPPLPPPPFPPQDCQGLEGTTIHHFQTRTCHTPRQHKTPPPTPRALPVIPRPVPLLQCEGVRLLPGARASPGDRVSSDA